MPTTICKVIRGQFKGQTGFVAGGYAGGRVAFRFGEPKAWQGEVTLHQSAIEAEWQDPLPRLSRLEAVKRAQDCGVDLMGIAATLFEASITDTTPDVIPLRAHVFAMMKPSDVLEFRRANGCAP